MATGENGIATRTDCNGIVSGAFSSDLKKCPTYSEIIATNLFTVTGSWEDDQLVVYSYISVKQSVPKPSLSRTSWFPTEASSINVTVSNASSFTTSKSATWITVSTYGNITTVRVSENTGSTNRSGTVTFTCVGEDSNTYTLTLSITQSIPANAPDVSPDTHTASSSAGGATFAVMYATSFTTSCSATWITITQQDLGGTAGVVAMVSYTANTSSSSRTATITFTCIGNDGNTYTRTATITQEGASASSGSISSVNGWSSYSSVPSGYTGYKSAIEGHNSTWDECKITFSGFGGQTLKFYIKTDQTNYENKYDYVVVYAIDTVINPTSINNLTYNGTNVIASTYNSSNTGVTTDVANYIPVTVSVPDNGTHTVTLFYRKDSSGASGTDAGYLLIPNEYF